MPVLIRQATPNDALLWLDLLQAALGGNYPVKDVYDPAWVATQLDGASGQETWVVESEGQFEAGITILPPMGPYANPITNVARNFFRTRSYVSGAARELLTAVDMLAAQRGHWIIARVLASDFAQQTLLENAGFVCVGYQPYKHAHPGREGVLFYLRMGPREAIARLPLSESLPQINELATTVLTRLDITPPQVVRDGAVGYPLQTELSYHEATLDDFDLWRTQALTGNLPNEVSSGYNLGFGLLRLASEIPPRAYLGQREDRIAAGLAFIFDSQDKCLRIVDAFFSDDLSGGAMLAHAVEIAQATHEAAYLEIDVLMTAPRLLKSAEQLGFVAVAYLPAFYLQGNHCADVVKLIKLNLPYAVEKAEFTAQAKSIVEVVDRNFQDQRLGTAIIGLLQTLAIFRGLGEGELRKFARLFNQKLYRPGEPIFQQGDRSSEAYIIMRGQVEIFLENQPQPLATLGNGQIFGEQSFLEGGVRNAMARAGQACILLVVQRTAFNDLAQREPHLGMVIMRNIASELSNKLRRTDALLASAVRRNQ